jgi:hypothetical protein
VFKDCAHRFGFVVNQGLETVDDGGIVFESVFFEGMGFVI